MLRRRSATQTRGYSLYFESVAYEAYSRATAGLEFIKLSRRLLRQLETHFEAVAEDKVSELPNRPSVKLQVSPEATRSVFVIHGRNSKAKKAFFRFLRSLNVQPIEWSKAVELTGKGSPYVGEVLEAGFAHARASVVLLSGDDEARLREEFRREDDPPWEVELTPQVRPNVLFEAGMAFGKHPERTILVKMGTTRRFSDIEGKHYVDFDGSAERRKEIMSRLKTAGCELDDGGSDWLSEGDFNFLEES